MSKRYSHIPPGKGLNYDWLADHTFVKVASTDINGAYTLREDNLKANFKLGPQLHREHAETFYILEVQVDFYVDSDWITTQLDSCLHIPPGVENACILADMALMEPSSFEDEAKMAALDSKYDIVHLGPVPDCAIS